MTAHDHLPSPLRLVWGPVVMSGEPSIFGKDEATVRAWRAAAEAEAEKRAAILAGAFGAARDSQLACALDHAARLKDRLAAGRDPSYSTIDVLGDVSMELQGLIARGSQDEMWRQLLGPAVDLIEAVRAMLDDEE